MKKLTLFIFMLPLFLQAQFHDARPVKVIKEVELAMKKEKLEKENQDLKNKQAVEAYSYGNGYSSTLTSKTSKEIDSFINQMIKEAKA